MHPRPAVKDLSVINNNNEDNNESQSAFISLQHINLEMGVSTRNRALGNESEVRKGRRKGGEVQAVHLGKKDSQVLRKFHKEV